MTDRVYFKKERELHNALIYIKRTYDKEPQVIKNGMPKGIIGMIEVSIYIGEILRSQYDVE